MVVTMLPETPKTLAEREAALRRGDPATWIQIGQWLNDVERTEYWHGRTKSFTEWLKSSAPELKVKEGSLWRYLTASRYYSRLRERLQVEGVDCPPVANLPAVVSPENLELLAKIERVVPTETFRHLAARVLSGAVSRAELRRCWQTYRSVLDGQTARGNAANPRFDPTDARQSESMLLARTRAMLHEEGSRWAGASGSGLFRLYDEVPVGIPERPRGGSVLDMVAVTQAAKEAPLRFHALAIVARPFRPEVLEQLVGRLMPYGDYVWLVFVVGGGASAATSLPAHVGLLESGECLRVVRPAATDASLGSATGETAKGVLTKTL